MLVIVLGLLAVSAAFGQEGRSVWDGVYSAAQATRGEAAYSTECARCHRDDLSGYNSALLGKRFMERWSEDSLQSFFDAVRNTMPRNAPRSLPDDEYLDIVTYVLRVNAFPEGPRDLQPPLLASVRVQGKQGPAPVPDFSLVSAVGCLGQSTDGTWTVAKATEPVRTREPGDSTADELKALAGKPLGDHTFRLLDPGSVQSNPPRGQKVEVKGFLIRNPAGDSLNPTSLQSVAASCGPGAAR